MHGPYLCTVRSSLSSPLTPLTRLSVVCVQFCGLTPGADNRFVSVRLYAAVMPRRDAKRVSPVARAAWMSHMRIEYFTAFSVYAFYT